MPQGTSEAELTKHCLYQLETLLKQQTAPSDTAAILVEPVIGEGGYIAAPSAFMKGLRDICDKNGILLICDEVRESGVLSWINRLRKYLLVGAKRIREDGKDVLQRI